jgi:hypothetical protein
MLMGNWDAFGQACVKGRNNIDQASGGLQENADEEQVIANNSI